MGLEASCPISRITMDKWITEVKRIQEWNNAAAALNPIAVEKLSIHLLKKYVDNVSTALDTMRPGIEWNRSTRTFIWSPEKEQTDKNQNMEQITMQEFARMASDVLDCLNFTWDSPSCNSNNRCPSWTHSYGWGCPTERGISPKTSSLIRTHCPSIQIISNQ